MNRYGRLAYDHTRQHRPKAFAAMGDPVAHFTRLGEQVEGQITTLRDQIVESPRPDESLEDYRRRSYQAIRQAEEVVLAEAVWSEPEPTTDAEDEQVLAYRSWLGTVCRTLASLDRSWTELAPEAPPQP
ncbi:MAG: hypothetical protein M3P53_01885 [Actinomycetota bacterium]|jgi:hypothetical protein|nr:hypothetical protein [Actinomycetota bacterium]